MGDDKQPGKDDPLFWHKWVTFKTACFCSQCGEQSTSPNSKLKHCSRCRSVFYCNVECQRKHWKKGGHKARCKEPVQDATVDPKGEYPGMFPLIDRDLPSVDEKILSYLSPEDLANAKLVSKKWYIIVHRNQGYLRSRVLAEIVATPGLRQPYPPDVEIVAPPKDGKAQYGVRIQGKRGKKFVRASSFIPVPNEETVRVCRMSAKGEKGFYGGFTQDTRWPLSVLDTMPYEVSPVSELLGIPLRVTRVQPRSELVDRVDYDNQGYNEFIIINWI